MAVQTQSADTIQAARDARATDRWFFARAGLFTKPLYAAGLTAMLASVLVGIQTISSTGALSFATRFSAVGWAAALVFLGYLAVGLIQRGFAPVAAVGTAIVGIAMAALLLATENHPSLREWLPFSAWVVNWSVVVVATVLCIRALLTISRERRPAAPVPATETAVRRTTLLQRLTGSFGAVLVVFGGVLPFLPFADRRIVDVATLVVTYIMLGWGLNVVVGLAGLLDLGYVAFYAVGAYSYAMFATQVGLSFWLCVPIAAMIAASFGVLLGFPVLRLRGDYLAIVTLGFGEMIRIILINWWWFTGGPNGITDVPRPSFFGLPFERNPAPGTESFHTFFGLEYSPNQRVFFLYYLILGFALLTNFFTLRVRRLPLGRAWEALREDETACRALGINPTNTKLTAFAIGAAFAGIAGSFFAARQGFVSPESFTFLESAVILAIVVLGGLGSQVGIVLAAIVLIGLPEFVRELADYRMLAFGIGMVLIMVWRPGGLLAHRDPTLYLSRYLSRREPLPKTA